MEKDLTGEALNRIAVAKDKLKSAEILLHEGQYRDAVSRAYYAMYYGATALLIKKGEAPKTHKGVMVLLHQHFVKEGTLDADFAKAMQIVKRQREDADYEPEIKITQGETEDVIKKAENFVAECEKLV